MYQLRSFHLQDMTACGAAIRRLGKDATNIEEVADRLVRHLYTSFVMAQTGEPVCVLVRLFKTTSYDLLTPDLQALADAQLGDTPGTPSLTYMNLLASAGAVPGWNDPARSSRFRLIPLGRPEDVDQLPMFSQLFRQLGAPLPQPAQPAHNVLLDSQEHAFNVFHILQAEGSPHIPAQEEFVLKYGIRSALGFGARLPNGELFSIILFSKDFIPESTAQLFKPLALCARIALAPFANRTPALQPSATPMPGTDLSRTEAPSVAHLQSRIAELEQLLAVHEQTVDAQANRMELIVHGAQVGTWDWDIPIGRVTINERWASMIGYQLDDIDPYVQAWERLIHPEDKPAVMAAIAAHLRGDTPGYSSEHRLRTKSGGWHWVFDSGRVLVRDANGAPLRAAGILLDISARKELEQAQARAQEALQSQQQALDEAQALAHLGFWERNIATGAERWSKEQSRIFGLDAVHTTPSYALFLAALHPEDRGRVQHAVDAALKYDTAYNVDCRIIRPGGEVRHINCRGVVHREADGRPTGMAGTVLDITDYKRAEYAWRDSETRMRSIFESAIEGIVVVDEQGRIENINAALLHLLGYAKQELIGQNISLLMPAPYRENPARYLAEYLLTGQGTIIAGDREMSVVRKDGAAIDIHVSVSEMQIGTAKRYTGMIRDISARKHMEEALRESEERFRQLADHIDAVFWLATADHSEVLYVSPAFETIWGLPPDRLYARPALWLEQVHPEDRHRVGIATACQAYLPYDEEYRIITPGGAVRWIRDRSFPIKDQSGGVFRMAGIAQDITDAKQLEAQLRASERRHRSLVELSPHAVFVNCEDKIVFANQACVRLFGAIAPSQLFGKPVLDLIHPESQGRAQETIARIQSTNRAVSLIEERFVALDGSFIDVEVAAAPITFEGKPAIQVILTDIRARKELEQALVATNLQLQTILASATNVCIIATNIEGMITTFNTGAEALLGYSAIEMIGQHPLALLHVEEELERHAKELSDLYARPILGFEALIENARLGGCDEREWTYRRKDGSRLTVLLTITALRNNDGAMTGFLAIGKDITLRKEAEAALVRAAHELERKNVELAQARDAALQAAQLKADFLATMSHEIRTPMNAIIGMAGLLLDTALTEEQHEFADSVRRSSDALLTLINDILDFSKIEAGKLHFEHITFDLRTTIEDTLDLLAEQAQSKDLELIALVDVAVPTGVVGDPGRLRQILVNLVGNAIKFTSTGEIFVHVTRDRQRGPDHLRFSITDTGIGIPEETQRRLFQAFVQADSSTTRRFGGTGLGLAICQRLVAQMQGQIGVESHPGQGSTFWFTAQLPEAALETQPSAISWNRLRGSRLLFVDQNKTARQALREELTVHGVDCIGVQSGREALETARAAAAIQKTFDLALIELHLPEMDGFETARLFKSDPATASIRLVILTRVGHRADATTAQTLGIDAYLTKPLRQTQLLECLCLLLNHSAPSEMPASPAAPRLITRHTPAKAETLTNPRLLLAEDNPVNQKVACKMLEKLGYPVDVAGNGQEAVAAHARSPYQLIFMDCQMPEVDGFEATARIRKMEGRSAHTPIIAMTANAMQGDREHCLASGMDDYVAKPIRPKDLQAILDIWLHKRTQAAAS